MEKPSHLPPGVKKTILMNHLEGRDSHDKGIYLQTYFASLDQAYKLLEEAELLYKNESFHRAFFLGISALEEISKSQMAADVYTGLLNEDHFKSAYKDHKKPYDINH